MNLCEANSRLPSPWGCDRRCSLEVERRAGAGLKEAAESSCPVEGMVKLLQVT